MSYVNVDVELDEFDTDELCDEIIKRMKSFGRKKPTQKQINAMKDSVSDLADQLNIGSNAIPNSSLDDQLKIEYLSKNWEKFTFWQLEEKLNA